MDIQELYTPVLMAANASQVIFGNGIGGFICTVTGTITVTDGGSTLVAATPVTAGVYLPMPLMLNAGSVQLAGGAAGTLCVAQ